VRLFTIDTRNPEIEKSKKRAERDAQPETISQQRNRPLPKRTDEFPSLRDFYNTYDEFVVTEQDRAEYQKFLAGLTDRQKELLQSGLNFYVVDLKNIGRLVMPVILEVEYADGTKEELRLLAEIWRYNNKAVPRLIMIKKEIRSIVLDPHLETADIDLSNNSFPRRPVKTRFQIVPAEPTPANPMQQQQRNPAQPTASPSPGQSRI
jgi:hypothetical protein